MFLQSPTGLPDDCPEGTNQGDTDGIPVSKDA